MVSQKNLIENNVIDKKRCKVARSFIYPNHHKSKNCKECFIYKMP